MTPHRPDEHFVAIRTATKRFLTPEGTTLTALDRVTLDVRGNEFITLLGPSGCGKTTLLRTISGFEALDEGHILIDGQPIDGVPPHRRPVNTVFQSYALFPHLTVGDNVGYSLDVAGVAKTERNRRVAEALELVNLTGMERRKPRQLSGGQQQRVALARAIVNRPKLLLLDEPLSALDRKLRQAMQLELKNIQHELGISFIFVTHDQEEALTMSDRIAVLDQGKVQQISTPTEVYDQPRNTFVARFVGESNLFRGRVTALDGGVATVDAGLGVPLRAASTPNLSVGQTVTVMIRPEHLSPFRAEEDSATLGRINGTLRQSVFVGSDFQLILDLPGGVEVKAAVRDTTRGLVADMAPGSEVQLCYRQDVPHLIPVEAEP